MQIENNIKTNATKPIGETTSAKPGQTAVGSVPSKSQNASVGGKDGVQLSIQLQSIEKKLASVEVFDAVRVEEIKRAISEGRFTVNPDKVADGLLDTVRDLIHRGKGD
ncbi:anti-sigma-28 factor, FlgM family [Nitrosospira sp. Nsp18]|uniref:flagellar biosynthesis anti-sigma factor FlgM n=1 Tax=Nitrosospira sp. Nsp18 TaxID=1855334 RepID=UPI0008886FAF|nr:flagellar biosynthesis anti-sigma factor FlgM [Nitrosospira sp. Nsp18]SDA11954.1 anti-sigma-28 factor, FlgM family [Nitrosospira sp. Nsp18]